MSCEWLRDDDAAEDRDLMDELSEDDADDLRDDLVEDLLDDIGTGADWALCTGDGVDEGSLGGEE